MKTTENIEKKVFVWTTIYWKWDSALWIAPLDHMRDDELKGHKVQITFWANGLWKSSEKDMIYLEGNEMLFFLCVLNWTHNEAKAIRGANISWKNKSITIQNVKWKTYINCDVEGKSKLWFSIDDFHKLIIYKILFKQLWIELNRVSWLDFTPNELKEYIKELIKTKQVEEKETEKTTKTETNIEDNWEYTTISYTNNYMWKDYKNEFKVYSWFYNKYLKDLNIKELEEGRYLWLIKSIKENTSEDDFNKIKFLNINNILTLKI